MTFSFDASGINPNSRRVAPDGDYQMLILDVSDEKDGQKRLTKKNRYPYVNVECAINEGDYTGIKVYHNVTFMPKDQKGSNIAIGFLRSIGEPFEGAIEVDPVRWMNKKFKAKIIESKDNKGRPKNEIAYLIQDEQTEESSVPF